MKCNQIKCDSIATYRVFWPGREPLPMCKEHMQVAITIATSMGMFLYAEEMKDDTSRESKSDSQGSKGEVY